MPLPRALRRFMLLVASVLMLLATLLRACAGDDVRGDWGEACVQSADCRPALFCGIPQGAPYCTNLCTRSDECPSGWTCAGVCRKPR